jgi:AraC-like DNA-binding protein/quercetin dioxygenase-like cupin family protein
MKTDKRQGEVPIIIDNSDIIMIKEDAKKAAKAKAYHSPLSEHFEGNLPLFVNRWEEGFDLREHDHAYVEIVYVMAGEGYHYIGGRVERAGKGCLYVLPIGTSHILRPSDASGKNSLLVYNLCIRPDFVHDLREGLSRYGDCGDMLDMLDGAPGGCLALTDYGMKLGSLFEHMHEEFVRKEQGYEASMLATMLQLIVRLARMLRPDTSLASAKDDASKTARMSSILSHIHHHLDEPLTAEGLATASGISKRHFIRLFAQHTGMGFSDYLQHKRMEGACRQLLESDDKIAHIAANVGYRDVAHFRSVFRKIIGKTPREYRAQRIRRLANGTCNADDECDAGRLLRPHTGNCG